jgi:hypothetical protein
VAVPQRIRLGVSEVDTSSGEMPTKSLKPHGVSRRYSTIDR